MNPTKKRILHELGLKKAQEDYRNSLIKNPIDFRALASEYQQKKIEEASKMALKESTEVIPNEYD